MAGFINAEYVDMHFVFGFCDGIDGILLSGNPKDISLQGYIPV
jgi:hypothetical protein